MSRLYEYNDDNLMNGHVTGATEQPALAHAHRFNLQDYVRRWLWLDPLLPCGCPGKEFMPSSSHLQRIDFPNESFYNYAPTAGNPGAAIHMQNTGQLGEAYPNQQDDLFQSGDPLQRALYDSLNSYWEDQADGTY